jgi:hypothetical protein
VGSYIKPIAEKFDIYDGEPWTEMDVRETFDIRILEWD